MGVYMIAYIGDIAKEIPKVPFGTPCHQVDQIFHNDLSLQGIVITEQNSATALITRTNFYQKMGTQYGYNLYIKKPIEILANNNPLIVNFFTSIVEVSKLAMDRSEEEIYDDVIIQLDDIIVGVVSIKSLLMKVSDIQVEFASYLNPLTRLPGNIIINQNLNKVLEHKKEFSLLYIDLDRFKAYNDYYGFKKGDEILQLTADLLTNSLDNKESFLGHIGGDDFIVLFNHYFYEDYCDRVINAFDKQIKKFYTNEHLKENFIYTTNREYQMEKIPLVSISIAVVTNEHEEFTCVEDIVSEATRLKKICKMKSESCFYVKPILV